MASLRKTCRLSGLYAFQQYYSIGEWTKDEAGSERRRLHETKGSCH